MEDFISWFNYKNATCDFSGGRTTLSFVVEFQCQDFSKDLPENNQTSVECFKTFQALQRENRTSSETATIGGPQFPE